MLAGLFGEGFRDFPVVDHFTTGVFMHPLDDGDKLWWKAVVVHQSPDDIPVDAIERLLEFHKNCVQGGLPLQALLDDDVHGCHVVHA